MYVIVTARGTHCAPTRPRHRGRKDWSGSLHYIVAIGNNFDFLSFHVIVAPRRASSRRRGCRLLFLYLRGASCLLSVEHGRCPGCEWVRPLPRIWSPSIPRERGMGFSSTDSSGCLAHRKQEQDSLQQYYNSFFVHMPFCPITVQCCSCCREHPRVRDATRTRTGVVLPACVRKNKQGMGWRTLRSKYVPRQNPMRPVSSDELFQEFGEHPRPVRCCCYCCLERSE